MPVIPTSDSFVRQTPNLRTVVSTPDYTPLAKADLAVGKGYEEAGKGMLILDAGIQKKKLADDTFDYTIARSQYLQKTIELEDQLRNEPDFTKIPQIKQERMNQIRSETSSMVSNPKLSAHLNSEMDLQGVKSNIEFDGIYRAKRNDADRATTQEEIGTIEQAIASTTNKKFKEELIITRNQLVASAEYRGAIDKESASKIIQDSSERIAINEISALPESQQIAALGARKEKNGTITFAKTNTFADNLPVAKKLAFYQRVQQTMKQKQDDYISQIKRNDFLTQRNAEENSMKIVLQGGTAKDIPIEQYARLSASQRKNLDTIRQRQNGLVQTDPIEGMKSYDEYSRLYANDPAGFAKVDPTEIRASVSPDKVDQVIGWQNEALQGKPQNADEASFQQTADHYAKNILGKKLSSKDAVLFTNKLREERKQFITTKGRQPTNEELKSLGNGLVSDVTVGGMWESKEPLYKLKGEFKVPDEDKNIITQQIKKQTGKPATEEQIRKVYENKLNKDVVKGVDVSFFNKALDIINPISDANASEKGNPNDLLKPNKPATMDRARQYILDRYAKEMPTYTPKDKELDNLAQQAISQNLVK